MTESSNKPDQAACILSSILDVGEMMLIAGAEVNRVENTICHMGTAYGYTRVDVFTITSSIVVTVHGEDGTILTQTRRISEYETDMWKIEKCNALSRKISNQKLSLEDFQESVLEIRKGKRYSDKIMLFCYGGVSGVFSIFFGGGVGDGAAAFLGGLILWFVIKAGKRLRVQNIVLTLLSSAVVGLSAVLFTEAGLGKSVDQIIIGNIMPLIPGLFFTTSLRDMISGDIISGLLGLCEAILKAVAIAAGIALVLWRFG